MYKRGITLGKFLYFHKGHELLLETASANCEHLTVLVGDRKDDTFPYDTRREWISNFLTSLEPYHSFSFSIFSDLDVSPELPKDEHGTVTDEGYWSDWLKLNDFYLSSSDVVFTSDRYGAEIANRVPNLEWFPVDPDRELYPVSSTMVSANLPLHYHLISDFAKPSIGTTIAIVGAESTGKSTMTKAMSRRFGAAYAPEWGRTISEYKSNLNEDDFDHIVDMQQRFIRKAQLQTRLSLTDTETITTELLVPVYSEMSHHKESSLVASFGQKEIDHYIVLAPTVPLVDDGYRLSTEEDRQKFHRDLIAVLTTLKKSFTIVDSPSFESRTAIVHNTIEDILRGYFP